MPRKGENIYKRKDGRWEARYIKHRTPDGKAIYGYVYATSYKEVKRKRQILLVEAGSSAIHPYDNQKPVTFECMAHDWYQSIAPQVKESTKNKYGNLLNSYIIPRLGSLTIDSLTYEVIEEQANHLLATGGRTQCGLSPKTVSDILSVIRCILKYAARNGNTILCDARAIQVKRCIFEDTSNN